MRQNYSAQMEAFSAAQKKFDISGKLLTVDVNSERFEISE
jgi:hypothetical protein